MTGPGLSRLPLASEASPGDDETNPCQELEKKREMERVKERQQRREQRQKEEQEMNPLFGGTGSKVGNDSGSVGVPSFDGGVSLPGFGGRGDGPHFPDF